jgi:hypothetical protein
MFKNENLLFFTGNVVLLREKLLSIPYHLSNRHKFDENQEFKKCPHGDLVATAEKPWLNEDSLV